MLAGPVRPCSHNDAVTCIDQVLNHRVAADRLHKALVEGADRVLSVVDALGPILVGSEDRVFREEVHKGVEITPVPVLNGLPHDLHVLLRHRPRSISLLR